MFRLSVPQSSFSEAYIETASHTFNSVHNMNSITIYETGSRINFFAKHIPKTVNFNHVLTTFTVTTTKVALWSTQPDVCEQEDNSLLIYP